MIDLEEMIRLQNIPQIHLKPLPDDTFEWSLFGEPIEILTLEQVESLLRATRLADQPL